MAHNAWNVREEGPLEGRALGVDIKQGVKGQRALMAQRRGEVLGGVVQGHDALDPRARGKRKRNLDEKREGA
eukprot:CAMPEP_0206237532 /NCGR_PEP_ID=MMETSP0047_2-20121206/14319_1 /ASSEMBLY_ACC=CAM_ASM_000192 /TAXON_ID=195065 /ORGANISM="Chroomonas mesostigmatica_cf, Strain CCMP1168" /LENGTH=71 /DNA_ID=CAMNT_0053661981 /DNA_START=141 /DNA_END=356 /DNA_ORIENTATION=+